MTTIQTTFEGPKVYYNQSTPKYVMYPHIDGGKGGYSLARIAVFTCGPVGETVFVKSELLHVNRHAIFRIPQRGSLTPEMPLHDKKTAVYFSSKTSPWDTRGRNRVREAQFVISA